MLNIIKLQLTLNQCLNIVKYQVTQLAVTENIILWRNEDLRLGSPQKTPEWYTEGVKHMREEMIEALRKHHEGHIEKHKTNVEVLLQSTQQYW